MEHADVIVIGAGSIGAMTLWQLSQSPNTRVIGFDQHPRVNLRSSYAGESRLFRTAVKEGPVFNDHANTSIDLWRTLEQVSGRPILHQCGALSIGPADIEPMRATQKVVEQYGLPHETLTTAQLHTRYPQFSSDVHDIGILDTRGGVLRPEVAVSAAQLAAEANGAKLYFSTPVTNIASTSDGVEVVTTAGTFSADQVVVATGSWTSTVLPVLEPYVEVHPIGLTWAMPRDIAQFTPDRFPVFVRDRVAQDGSVTHWFGAPSLDGYSIKIGVYPEPWNTTIAPDEVPEEYSTDRLSYVGDRVAECIPNLIASPVRHSVHHDSFASNQIPIFDRLSNDQRILYATGMHGNAFKFAASYGKMLADIVLHGNSSLWRTEFSLAEHDRLP